MRRIITILVGVAAAIWMALGAFAAETVTMTLKPSKSTVYAGNSVEIVVSVSDFAACTGGSIKITYDTAIFERSNNSWTFSTTPVMSVPDGDATFGYGSSSATKVSGNIYKFTMTVKKDAPLGSYDITVKLELKNAEGSATATKTVSITVGCDHTYSNNCDTSCNACGATRKITHSWNSGKVTKAAGCTTTGEMLYTCKVCGETKTETIKKTGHQYDNDCDTDCNSCGETRKVTHTYASQWTSDEDSHWYACKSCGDKKDEAEHNFSTQLSGTDAGHGYVCTECGYVAQLQAHTFDHDCDADCNDCGYTRETEHNYSERWVYDSNGHWHACTVCGDELEMVPHTPGEEATETTDQFCLDCGYLIQVAGNHEHTKNDEWLTDETSHWFRCVCGVETEPVAHSWNAGLIDLDQSIVIYHCTECGYTRTEPYTPPTEPPETEPMETEPPSALPSEPSLPMVEEKEEFPLALLFSALFTVSMIGNVVLLICLIRKRRKAMLTE